MALLIVANKLNIKREFSEMLYIYFHVPTVIEGNIKDINVLIFTFLTLRISAIYIVVSTRSLIRQESVPTSSTFSLMAQNVLTPIHSRVFSPSASFLVHLTFYFSS